MKSILILTPYGKERDVTNLLVPLMEPMNIDLWSNDIFAKLLESKTKDNIPLTVRKLITAADQGYVDLCNHPEKDSIIVGWLGKKGNPTDIIAYIPDILEAEEELIDSKYNYKKNYYTCIDADYKINNELDLLKKVKECLTKKNELLN